MPSIFIQENCRVVKREQLTPTVTRLIVETKAKKIKPGQFAMLATGDLSNVLRRPISICRADADAGTVDLVFEARGQGTTALSRIAEGGTVDALLPLGNGFDLGGDKIAVVGGGIGIYPLLGLLEQSGAKVKHAYLGFRSRGHAHLLDEFGCAATSLDIATDDGSLGAKCFVTDLVKDKYHTYDRVYACGPHGMLDAVAAGCKSAGVACQVSLEQHMCCGIGACYVCVCATEGARRQGRKYSLVCSDGPVFDAKDIIWSET